MISDWVTTEVASALSIKVRMEQIDTVHQANALAEFNRLDRRMGEAGSALGVRTTLV